MEPPISTDPARPDRRYDIVLFGATGFTGGLAAEALARRAAGESGAGPVRWAIAGRNADKLKRIRERLESISPAAASVGLIEASVDDSASLERLAEQARVLITTVGPYAELGEAVVAACVASGTDYVDITGEPAFVNRIIERYDAPARARGLRLVPCCGFDSIPPDLGVWFAVRELAAEGPVRVEAFVRSQGTFSGGTWHSAVGAMSRFREDRRANDALDRLPEAPGRRIEALPWRVGREPAVAAWVCPLPTIDTQIILRSARFCPEYGRDFRYRHSARVGSLPWLVGGAAAVGTIFALAQLPPTRSLLLRVRDRGEGPSEAQRAKAFFEITLLAEGDGRRVLCRVRGGDPGYTETSKMVVEAALCLARDRDRLPERAGVLTPAAAMGEPLLERLRAVGIEFEVLPR